MAQKGLLDLFITPINDEPERFVYEELLEEDVFLAVPETWEVNSRLEGKAISIEELPESEAAAKSHRKAKPLTREEFACLCRETFVVLKPDQDIGRKMQALLNSCGCTPERVITAEQTMTTLALTLRGVGVSLITESSIRNCGFAGLPKLYMANPDICRRKMYIAYPRNKYLSKAARRFAEVLKEHNR